MQRFEPQAEMKMDFNILRSYLIILIRFINDISYFASKLTKSNPQL
jgi:hypothetical protein